MKRRHYIGINLIFIGLVTFSAIIVIQFMTGYRPFDIIARLWTAQNPTFVQTENCTTRGPLQRLSQDGNPQLKKLAVYQQACHSFVSDTVMIFLSMPKTIEEARAYAAEDAKLLKVFAEAHVRPLIIYEPSDKQGAKLDFALLANGTYSSSIDTYFSQLKDEGVSEAALGIITPFPEANLPYWNNNKVEYFAPAVNDFIATARTYFPSVATSIMLNSATYDNTDFNWERGDYNSLVPYVQGIKPGFVTYVGIQGFPWASRQGGVGRIFNAAEFLSPPLLKEMADTLQVKKVWFNTGTFAAKYTLDSNQTRTISAPQRKEILRTIQDQAMSLKEDGYEVAINLFAQDKSEDAEETDWSYWKNDEPFVSQDTLVLTSFIKQLRSNAIDFWLFDK